MKDVTSLRLLKKDENMRANDKNVTLLKLTKIKIYYRFLLHLPPAMVECHLPGELIVSIHTTPNTHNGGSFLSFIKFLDIWFKFALSLDKNLIIHYKKCNLIAQYFVHLSTNNELEINFEVIYLIVTSLAW